MCIICNLMADLDYSLADLFLHHEEATRQQMQKTASVMLSCAERARELGRPEVARRYDMTHKRMVKLIREWNSLQEFRENADCPRPSRA